MAARRDKAAQLDKETSELEQAAHKVSEHAEDLNKADKAEDKPKPKPQAKAKPKAAEPEPPAEKPETEQTQRPEPGKVIATRTQTPTAPVTQRVVAEPVPGPRSVTHPPDSTER